MKYKEKAKLIEEWLCKTFRLAGRDYKRARYDQPLSTRRFGHQGIHGGQVYGDDEP